MKTVIALIGLLATFGTVLAGQINLQDEEYFQAVYSEQRLFEGVINSTINSIIDIIAPFDPIQVDHQEIDIFGHHAEVSNVDIQGFSNVAATHISLGGFITWTLDLVIEAPLVTANIENWKVDGGLFYGDGAVSVKLENLKLALVASVNPITQYVKDLEVTPAIGNAEVSITGLFNNTELSQTISDSINYVLNDVINNNKELHDAISKILLQIVQKNV